MTIASRLVAVGIVVAVAAVAAAAPHRRHRERKHQHARALVTAPSHVTPPSPEPPAPAPVVHAQLDLVPTTAPPPEAPPPPPALVALTPPSSSAPTRPALRRDELGRQRRWALFGGGLALFLGGYALDAGATYGLGHQPATTSLIPLAGPLIQIGDSWAMVAPSNSGNPMIDGPANERIASVNHTIQVAATVVLAVDFALQLAGVTMSVVGVVGRAPPRYAASGTRVAWRVDKNGVAVTF